jgi:TolB-like protein
MPYDLLRSVYLVMHRTPRHTAHRALAVAVAGGIAVGGCRAPVTTRPGPDPVAEAEGAARQATAAEATINPASLPRRSLGVMPFAVAAGDTLIAPLGYALADILITDLQRSEQLQLVDRLRLDALLREVKLVEAGRVDPETAPRVGKLLGARRLIVGSLARNAAGQLTVNARIADASTGQVQDAVTASAPLADVLTAEKALAFRLLDELGINLTPAARARIAEQPTRNVAALLAYGKAVRYEVYGDYPRAATEYRTAIGLDPGFALAGERLSRVPGAGPPSGARANADRSSRTTVARASSVAVDRTNPVFFSPLGGGPRAGAGGAADPTFPSQIVIVLVTITTPP